LPSRRAAALNCVCMKLRCSIISTGNTPSTSTQDSNAARVTTRPAESSTTSSHSFSRSHSSSRHVICGSENRTAADTSTALTAAASRPQARNSSHQTSGRAPGSATPPPPARAWKTTEDPPYARPIAAAENTRRCTTFTRTRHWLNANSGRGASSAYTAGSRTVIGIHQAESRSCTFTPAGSPSRRRDSTAAAPPPSNSANSTKSPLPSGVEATPYRTAPAAASNTLTT
jgi:hypothetical protein